MRIANTRLLSDTTQFSDGDVRVCRTTVPDSASGQGGGGQRQRQRETDRQRQSDREVYLIFTRLVKCKDQTRVKQQAVESQEHSGSQLMPHTHFIFQEDWGKTEAELTGKADIMMAEFLAVGEAY